MRYVLVFSIVVAATPWILGCGDPTTAASTAKMPAVLEAGVVLEVLPPQGVLERAGLEEGDRVLGWRREVGTDAPRSGGFATVFDWRTVSAEESQRGDVALEVERAGGPVTVVVPASRWRGESVRPWLGGEVLARYQEGRSALDAGEVDVAAGLWRGLAADAPWHVAAWLEMELGAAYDGLAHRARREGDRARLETVEEWCGTAFGAAAEWASESPLALAHIWEAAGSAAQYRERYAASLEMLEKAWQIRKVHEPGSLQQAMAEVWMGVASKNRGRLDEAEGYLEAALPRVRHHAPGGETHFGLLSNLGTVELELGDFDGAEQRFHLANQIRLEQHPQQPKNGRSLHRLAMVAFARGAFAEAEDWLTAARGAARRDGETGLDTRLTFDFGKLAEVRGDFAAARGYFEEALEAVVRSDPGGSWEATARDALGRVWIEEAEQGAASGRGPMLAHAEREVRAALDLHHALEGEGLQVGRCHATLGWIAEARGDDEQAFLAHNQALGIFEQVAPEGVEHLEALLRVGEAAHAKGEMTVAEPRLKVARRKAASLVPDTALQAQVEYGLARVFRDTDRMTLAVEAFENAIRALEGQIGRLGGTRQMQAAFRVRYGRIFQDYIDVLIQLERPDEAFEVLERMRARAFLSMLGERALSHHALPDELTDRHRLLRGQLAQIRASMDSASLDASARAALRRDRQRLRLAYTEVLNAMHEEAPGVAALYDPQPLGSARVRGALDAGTALIAWSVGRDRTHVFVLGPKALVVRTLEIDEASLDSAVGRLREALGQSHYQDRDGVFEAKSEKLYRLLLEPLRAILEPADRLLIVADGPLHRLPWAALLRPPAHHGEPVEERYLVAEKALHLAPSATAFVGLRADRSRARVPPVLAAFGDPVYPAVPVGEEAPDGAALPPSRRSILRLGQELGPLPASGEEVTRIADLIGDETRVFLGPDATEEQVKRVAPTVSWLHFAVHSVLDDRNPLASALYLTLPTVASSVEDGALEAWEVLSQMELRAELVVLSSCASAGGEIEPGEGLLGLTRAFQTAGARSVVATLESVEDQATSLLMTHLYRALGSGVDKAEALRRAQLAMIRSGESTTASEASRWRAPYYWAVFQLYGDVL